jgi:hypothetical protein
MLPSINKSDVVTENEDIFDLTGAVNALGDAVKKHVDYYEKAAKKSAKDQYSLMGFALEKNYDEFLLSRKVIEKILKKDKILNDLLNELPLKRKEALDFILRDIKDANPADRKWNTVKAIGILTTLKKLIQKKLKELPYTYEGSPEGSPEKMKLAQQLTSRLIAVDKLRSSVLEVHDHRWKTIGTPTNKPKYATILGKIKTPMKIGATAGFGLAAVSGLGFALNWELVLPSFVYAISGIAGLAIGSSCLVGLGALKFIKNRMRSRSEDDIPITSSQVKRGLKGLALLVKDAVVGSIKFFSPVAGAGASAVGVGITKAQEVKSLAEQAISAVTPIVEEVGKKVLKGEEEKSAKTPPMKEEEKSPELLSKGTGGLSGKALEPVFGKREDETPLQTYWRNSSGFFVHREQRHEETKLTAPSVDEGAVVLGGAKGHHTDAI